MKSATKTLSLMALYAAVYAAVHGTAVAQQPASPTATTPAGPDASAVSGAPATPAKTKKATAQSEAGEPRADTGDTTGPAASSVPPAPTKAGRTSSAVPPAPTAAGRTPSAVPPAPVTGQTPSAGATPAGPGSGQKSAAKIDRLELGTATVTGDREQPKVMYIVPWKRSDIGDLTGKPMNSLVDEILAPVDRDVFKREVVYYQVVQAEASQNGAPPKPAQQGEK
jgi:hypothetical protein